MISAIYRFAQTGLPSQIREGLTEALAIGEQQGDRPIFYFRADDIGVPSFNFFKMMDLFVTYRIPLNLAVVPAWLTRKRWESIEGYHRRHPDLFCWHQHGFRHANHEKVGKKQEFGSIRSSQAKMADLEKGKAVLQSVMSDRFFPFFTPPWNRCDMETMQALSSMRYKGISRHYLSQPPVPKGLKELFIHVDLHTRKEKKFTTGWEHVFRELRHGMKTGRCGVMLHHMRMDDRAFIFLDYLLEKMRTSSFIKTMKFDQMV